MSRVPICIVDTCVGGLSIVNSLWKANLAGNANFIADYTVNPLGTKSDSEISDVIDRWIAFAQGPSDTLVLACNTLSIRYHQLVTADLRHLGPERIVTLADCVAAMARNGVEKFAGRNVLIVGTAFTASQALYPELLRATVPSVRVSTVAATGLERMIARFEPGSLDDESILTDELRYALERTDVAVLACTCFPMVIAQLIARFPGVEFVDPGAFAPHLLSGSVASQDRKVRIRVTGDVVSADRVKEFAEQYLGSTSIELY